MFARWAVRAPLLIMCWPGIRLRMASLYGLLGYLVLGFRRYFAVLRRPPTSAMLKRALFGGSRDSASRLPFHG